MVTARQLSFAGGEVAPSLYARVDTIKYATGLRTARNMMVMRHGGATSRSGTRFVAEVKDSSKTVKLIPFIFNNQQTYVLEFGDLYMRVIKDGAQLTLTSATVNDWATSTAYVVGDLVEEPGASGNFYYCIQAHTSSGVNQPPNASFWYAIPGSEYEIPTPYALADLSTLQFVQSADVITIAHPNYAPRDLSRTADTTWVLSPITFAPSIAAPTGGGVSGTAGGNTFTYRVTSIAAGTFEESLPLVIVQGSLADPTTSAPHTITWTNEPAAQEYNVYLEVNGIAGFIGVSGGSQFINDNIIPDTTDSPPIASNPFSGAGNFPSTVSYFQQRLMFANTDNNPERIWGSRSAQRTNFTQSVPLQDDDSVELALFGRQVNEVQHLVELGSLVVFTTGGEWAILGDAAGTLTPFAVNPRQHSYNGAATLPPLVIGGNALYLQARSSIVRDLGFDFVIDGYRGNDLTLFSAHLFDRFTITDWAYQQVPHSIVWAIRNDGTLLGLTYVPSQELIGWHRHDTDGTFENVVVVPESNEDSLYVVVNRTINGATRRYIEQFTTRQIDPEGVEEMIFLDSSLSYDGTNTTGDSMTLSGGPPWTPGTILTLTASGSQFVAGDVGNEIHLTGADGTELRVEIQAFSSATVVSVLPQKTVPTSLQNTATTNWCKAVDTFSGLDHLEGKDVAALGDGFVDASPNNAAYTTKTVSGGSVTLDKPRCRVHIGLPYISDIETLDLDTTQGETLADKKKLITELTMFTEDTRGVWVGPKPPSDDATDPLEDLREVKIRDDEEYDDPVALHTGTMDVKIKGEWNRNGRTFIRQVDPVPMTILSVAPAGYIPYRS